MNLRKTGDYEKELETPKRTFEEQMQEERYKSRNPTKSTKFKLMDEK